MKVRNGGPSVDVADASRALPAVLHLVVDGQCNLRSWHPVPLN